MTVARPALPPVLAAMLIALGACRSGDAPAGAAPSTSSTPFPEGVVARVGSLDIHARSVARIAAAQSVELARARDLAIRDALFASEASARGLEDSLDVRLAVRGALARMLLHELYSSSARVGPATFDELRDATERRFLDLDRPPGARTVHAVLRLGKRDAAARRKHASSIAEAIRAAVAPLANAGIDVPDRAQPQGDAPDPLIERFRQAAAAVPHDGFELIIEPLPPVAADGRVLEPGGKTFALEFASAAAALMTRGEVSPLVESPFGLHVIMLLERTPSRTVPLEERRQLAHANVIADRARAARRDLLQQMRHPIAIDPSADAMLAIVAVHDR
jgi:peptidyl-prolyl cis-trans isomerase C